MSLSILIVGKDSLMRPTLNKTLEEWDIHDFMVGTYNQSLRSDIVVFTDGSRYRIVKHKD